MISADGDNLDVEDESGVGWDDTASTCGTVPVVRWAGKSGLSANFESNESLIPALDDLAGTNNELKWLTSVVAGVELVAIALELSAVVSLDFLSGLDDGTGSLCCDIHLEFRHSDS